MGSHDQTHPIAVIFTRNIFCWKGETFLSPKLLQIDLVTPPNYTKLLPFKVLKLSLSAEKADDISLSDDRLQSI